MLLVEGEEVSDAEDDKEVLGELLAEGVTEAVMLVEGETVIVPDELGVAVKVRVGEFVEVEDGVTVLLSEEEPLRDGVDF